MSSNGRGGWEPVEGVDATVDTPTLALPDGDELFYRAVATYDADGAGEGTVTESIYSDAVQVADVRDTAGTAPSITGNAFVGGTLSVDVRNTSVQWQERIGDATTGNWVDISGATGSLTLTQAHAGKVIRALVSYHSTTEDGITAIVAVEANGGAAIPGGTTASATPVAVDDYTIEASVAAPGHGRDLNGAEAGDASGHNLSVTHTVPLASLFQDPDGPRLSFTAAADAASGLGADANSANSATDGTYVFDAGAGGVLVFNARTGVLNYESDVYRTHDGSGGDANDGAGNVITLNITASDGTNSSSSNTDTDAQTAAVNLRINVAPTDIHFAAATDTLADAADGTTTVGTATTFVVTVAEHVGVQAAPSPAGMLIAHVDVQDENSDMHKFGTHEVTVSGDDRFMITHTGYTGLPTSQDDRLGSTWEVRLKPGAKLDFETDGRDLDPTVDADNDGNTANDKQIQLTLTATDSEGLSTPSGPGTSPITLTITITDVDAAGGDRNHPLPPSPGNVPGLEDDETTDPDDERIDDDTDDDTDGGANPPPPGMSLGGIIEDFVDNMDTFEQDLLEDFMLVIDDIDIA